MTDHTPNPLLDDRDLPAFDRFAVADIAPAIATLIERCEAARTQTLDAATPADFDALSALMDPPLQALSAAWGTVMHLQSVNDTPELRAAVAEQQPKVTAFFTSLSADLRLYERYKLAAERGDALTAPQRRALSLSLQGFRLSGAELEDAKKPRFAEIQQRSATLSREFSNRLLDATDAFVDWADASEMEGVPAEVQARLAAAAQADGRADSFKLSLQQPTLGPLMQHGRHRGLRERLYRANATRASELGPETQNNLPVMAELMALRQERAQLLGYPHHAEVSLIPKMANSTTEVLAFLRDLARRARPLAESELAELQAFARETLSLDDPQVWDIGFAAEQLRQARYAFSEQEVQQHFQLDRVLDGLFGLAKTLFDVDLVPATLPGWHEDVRGYRVERGGELLGHCWLDPFARAGKRAGAWMNGARPRWRRPDGSLRTAVAYLVTNVAKPVDGQPALLRHSDVVTLFHEFGHGLHFLLSQVDVPGVAGISGVEWDAVELPSQLMENFAWDWALLSNVSAHAQTGEPLPRALYDKMIAARNFHAGLGLLRQVELALFDMRLHAEPARAAEALALMDEVRAEVALLPVPAFNRFPASFSHIFAGGYTAGYYSYLWAEVLACDAWEALSGPDGVRPEMASRYRQEILEVGGSRPMQDSFAALVGRAPRLEALLRQRGLATVA